MKTKITLKRVITALFTLFFIWLLFDSHIPAGVDESIVISRANRLYQNLALVDNYGGMPMNFDSFLNLLDEWGLKGNFVYGVATEPGKIGFAPITVSDIPSARVTGMGNNCLVFDETYPKDG